MEIIESQHVYSKSHKRIEAWEINPARYDVHVSYHDLRLMCIVTLGHTCQATYLRIILLNFQALLFPFIMSSGQLLMSKKCTARTDEASRRRCV